MMSSQFIYQHLIRNIPTHNSEKLESIESDHCHDNTYTECREDSEV